MRFIPADGVATLQTVGARSLARDNTSLIFSVIVAVELRQRAALAEAQEGLDIVMAQLKDAKARLAGVQKRLAELQKGFDDAVAKKQVCSHPCPAHTTRMSETGNGTSVLRYHPYREPCYDVPGLNRELLAECLKGFGFMDGQDGGRQEGRVESP